MPTRAVKTIWREGGVGGLTRKLSAATRMMVPRVLMRRRTGRSTGAYFDLVTDESRQFYGDSFHFGYFPLGTETLAEAVDAHTDLVAELAQLRAGMRVLDVGCGIGAPAVRIARTYDCHVTGINISHEQVRQGREMIAREAMSGQVSIQHGDARRLPYPEASFDAVVCVEVAGDICITAADKQAFAAELSRVLRPGGHLGFSDLALLTAPTKRERAALRSVFYDDGSQLVTDWAAVLTAQGFQVHSQRCVIADTLPTWDRVHEIYAGDHSVVSERYGTALTRRALTQLELMPAVLKRIGTFPVIAATKLPSELEVATPQAAVPLASSEIAVAAPDGAIAAAPSPQPTALVPPEG
jgi:cyclopropane fatty-acyl-phospholipid synthase-like methyltransferase